MFKKIPIIDNALTTEQVIFKCIECDCFLDVHFVSNLFSLFPCAVFSQLNVFLSLWLISLSKLVFRWCEKSKDLFEMGEKEEAGVKWLNECYIFSPEFNKLIAYKLDMMANEANEKRGRAKLSMRACATQIPSRPMLTSSGNKTNFVSFYEFLIFITQNKMSSALISALWLNGCKVWAKDYDLRFT